MAVEHAVALVGQVNVKLLRRNAVLRAFNAVCEIAVLIANKDIVWLLFLCFFDPLFSYPLDVFCLRFIICPAFFVCIL